MTISYFLIFTFFLVFMAMASRRERLAKQRRLTEFDKLNLTLENGWYTGVRNDAVVEVAMAGSPIRTQPTTPLPPDITIYAETWGPVVKRLVPSERDVELGDPEFDKHFRLDGGDAELRAMLSPSVRARMMELRGKSMIPGPIVSVREGHVYLYQSSKPLTLSAAPESIDELLEFAAQMSCPAGSTALQLAANFEAESVDACRRGTLRALLNLRSDDAHDVARELLTHDDPEVRVTVAVSLGDEGLDVLCAVALDRQIHESLRVSAVRHLAKEHGARVAELLHELIGDDSLLVRRFAMAALAELGEGPQLDQRVGGLALSSATVEGALAVAEDE